MALNGNYTMRFHYSTRSHFTMAQRVWSQIGHIAVNLYLYLAFSYHVISHDPGSFWDEEVPTFQLIPHTTPKFEVNNKCNSYLYLTLAFDKQFSEQMATMRAAPACLMLIAPFGGFGRVRCIEQARCVQWTARAAPSCLRYDRTFCSFWMRLYIKQALGHFFHKQMVIQR